MKYTVKMIINGIFIVDYTSRITDNVITKEGRKRLKEVTEFMANFIKEYKIKIVYYNKTDE